MKKQFGTLAVMGAYTGFLLEERGFGKIHNVMDHFYPGIMTIGTAAMQPNASREIVRQLPMVADVPGDPADWKAFAATCLERLGPTLDLNGPLNVTEGEAAEAFADLGRGQGGT